VDPVLTTGIKLTIIGTVFVFLSLFFLYLMIKVLNFFLNAREKEEVSKNDPDISLIISASVAYFLQQTDEEIFIPKVFREESNWKLNSRIHPIISGE
tara:strand:- start:1949 stop:2239 length:291 start_codon:yes stop_codon:yes gene_type:complete